MKILFVVHGFNSLSQRLFVELRARGHEVSVEFDVNDAVTEQAVRLHQPELIIAPFLKRAIPESVWRDHTCFVVHPGIIGDRGPSALDWALLEGRSEWGVTVLQANEIMDGGDIWASETFAMREGSKASLYRRETSDAAVRAVINAVERFQRGDYQPRPLNYNDEDVQGRERPLMKQADRAIDWRRDDTDTVLRKIRGADGFPGVRDELAGRQLHLFDAHRAIGVDGEPGELVARSGTAVCRATTDGAVWIGHLKDCDGESPFKLPATHLLGEAATALPELDAAHGYREIGYEEQGQVGWLRFPFYNGAMGSEQCAALLAAYREALTRPTRVIVLAGGPDFWSNGMNLNRIEAAESPADESWRNINAMDDLAEAIITTGTHLTIAALAGNAGAGGVFLARAADRVWARDGVVLNPHYKDMGNLYGSEFWSYLLPKRAGEERARKVLRARLPMGAEEARGLGLVDEVMGGDLPAFTTLIGRRAAELALHPDIDRLLEEKRAARAADEAEKPLAEYRAEELERMRLNFYGFDPSYHVARYNFVHKVPKSRTPVTIARHRDRRINKGAMSHG